MNAKLGWKGVPGSDPLSLLINSPDLEDRYAVLGAVRHAVDKLLDDPSFRKSVGLMAVEVLEKFKNIPTLNDQK